jgi:hypothetical protein
VNQFKVFEATKKQAFERIEQRLEQTAHQGGFRFFSFELGLIISVFKVRTVLRDIKREKTREKELEKWTSVGKSVDGIIGQAEFVFRSSFTLVVTFLHRFSLYSQIQGTICVEENVCFLDSQRCLHTDLVTGIPLFTAP